MKKLLSLLSILISGTTAPIVIADIPYKKNTIKNLSELNWTCLNINKNKRDTKTNKTKHIFKTKGADIPTEQQIKDKLKELNPQLDIIKINVKDITENSAKVYVIGYSGTKTINFTVDKSVPINEVITNNNLGEIDFSSFGNSIEQQIKFRLEELNPKLNLTKINFTYITVNSAKVNSNDTSIYTGEIDINYSRPIKSVVKNTELGLIITNGVNKPSEQQIKDKLKELNEDLKNTNDFKVKDITSTNAKISYKIQEILSGYVLVKFTSIVNLNKIITKTSLGEFKNDNLSNPTEQQIKSELKKMNPQLDITKIKVENISNNSASINSSDTNIYTGNVIVNYSISIESINW